MASSSSAANNLTVVWELVGALESVTAVQERLRKACATASSVQAIVLTDLITQAKQLERDIDQLRVAIEGDDRHHR